MAKDEFSSIIAKKLNKGLKMLNNMPAKKKAKGCPLKYSLGIKSTALSIYIRLN